MAKFELRVEWKYSSEYLFLDFDQLKEKDLLTTTEVWKGTEDPGPHKYQAVCVQVVKAPENDTFEVVLSYEKSRHPHLKEKLISWGNFRIVIKKIEAAKTGGVPEFQVSATSDGSNEEYKAERIIILSCDLDQEVYESVKRRIRAGQAAMRDDLMLLDKCCAISGETTLAALEAAHIVDVQDNGVASIQNSILLRADLHKLFDARALRIAEDGTLSIEPSAQVSPDYKNLIEGKRLEEKILSRISEALKNRRKDR